MIYTLKSLKTTGKYSFIKDEDSVNVHTIIVDDFQVKKDAVMDVIFAPNPFTGYPSSDLSLLLSDKTRPEVQNYIKNYLCQPVELPKGIDNPDITLDTLQTREMVGRRYDEYIAGLQKYISEAQADIEQLKEQQPMPINPLVGSALISGGASLLNSFSQAAANAKNLKIARETNEMNYKIFKESNEFNRKMALEQWNRETAYNHPAMQMQRALDAGLNPFAVMGSQSNTTGVSNMAPPSSSGAIPLLLQLLVKPTGFNTFLLCIS